MPNVGDIIRYENGEMEDYEVIEFFQGMITSGIVWQLQGSYGRMAASDSTAIPTWAMRGRALAEFGPGLSGVIAEVIRFQIQYVNVFALICTHEERPDRRGER